MQMIGSLICKIRNRFAQSLAKEGRKERIERGIAYGLCVEAIRTGVLLKDLVKNRIEPETVDIEITRWY